jgi:LysM repeat protein
MKDSTSDLSDEFKNEIKKSRKNRNFLGTILAFMAIVLIFGTIGIALYQLIEKPEATENKAASQKILSKPAADQKATTTTPSTPAATPATTTPAATTTTSTATTKDYTVVAGDTWSSIANANGMTSAALMKANSSTTENLQIGQVIKIPKS